MPSTRDGRSADSLPMNGKNPDPGQLAWPVNEFC